ncbi:MAG: glycine zipper domain-containing protein, partial [Verrucomicrobiota bacterium JB023]|nr:glycine zipper domain-containing protein [Verrucomicrobiota bacterium JB023]
MQRITRFATLSALSVALFASCTNTNPYTGELQYNRTTAAGAVGAATGAVAGAIIGNNVGDGDAGRGALIGGALGGLVGANVGRYQDQQEAAIRQQLQGTGVSVTRSGNDIILNMPHDITFGVD